MRVRIAAVLALLLTTIALVGTAPASAVGSGSATGSASRTAAGLPTSDDGATVAVRGILNNRSGEGDDQRVEGATVVVEAGGQEYEDVSDDQGQFEIEIPFTAGEQIQVTLDTDTLPDGVALRDEGDETQTRTLTDTIDVRVNFVLGAGDRQASSALDEVPQIIYNGLYFGVILALGALGLSMIFGTTGLTNFAHGELVTFGAIIAYTFNVTLQLPFVVAALIAIILSAAFGFLQDTVFWRRLRHRGTGLIAMMIVSIGLQFVLRNVYQFFTGGRTLTYREYTTPSGVSVGPITLTTRDIICLVASVVILAAVVLALQRTRVGRATRAIADNPALAASTGINVDRVVTIVWTVGAMLAGTCGVLLGFTQSVKFDLGAQILLVMFAAITVGGLGSIWGAIIGSLIVGVLIELSTLVIPSELKIAAALFLLIVILLVRPQGLLGRRERIG